ncbi:hypothetical protein WBG78_04305 [Chryseolinea sp. T2]|uniref:hypothetical protein n=1 Tax=Chryseolinea sp. T2 TaxID=3129255 RepID=UPI003076D592
MSKIESFFLNTFLAMSIVGTLPALAANIILHPSNHVSIVAQTIALAANVIAFIIRKKYPTIAVLILTGLILATIAFVAFTPPHNIVTHLSVIILCGFIHSVMLRGRLLVIMHLLCVICIVLTFRSSIGDITTRFSLNMNEAISGAITYFVLYLVLTYTTYILKSSYDKTQDSLQTANHELHNKAHEIEAQNEQLVHTQDVLSAVNRDLEKIVNERTNRIKTQNDVLIRYSYTNAHQLRGPVARLMGLASISQLTGGPDAQFIIQKMVAEAHAIDSVVKQINRELDSGHLDSSNMAVL